MELVKAIECINEHLSLFSIEEEACIGGVHYLIGCYRAPSNFYVISCSCGWRKDTGTSSGNAHAMLRAHIAGHSHALDADHA